MDVLGSTNGTWPGSDDAYTGGAHFWKNVSAAAPVWTQESHQLAFQTYVSATAPVPNPRDATEVQLTASADPAQTDHPITFTATVIDPAHPGSKPTGTVAFYRDGSADSSQTLDSNGKATYTTAFNGPGTHSVAAAYCPDTDAFESSEDALSQTVIDHFVSATALTVAPDPTVAGQDATFTATVSAVGPASEEPSGTVQFSESDGTPIGAPVSLVGREATLVASAGAGRHTVHAGYSGDSVFSASSGSIEQTVNAADTTTTISSDVNPVTAGGEVTFRLTVTTTPPGGVPPTGAVAITVNGQDVSGPIPLFDYGLTAGRVDVTFDAPGTPQTATVGAVYRGDEDTNPSVSPTFVQSVIEAPAAARPILGPSPAPVPTLATESGTTTGALRRMTARLRRAIRRRGSRALAGTFQTLTTSGPGVLSQRVFTPAAPTAALTARKKPVLLARARRTFASAGTGTLKLRLSRPGRKILPRAKSLRLSIFTRFTPKRGTPVIVVERLTAARRGRKPTEVGRATVQSAWRVTGLQPLRGAATER